MISLGRINLFYSRDETMKFLCLGHASNVNLFVAEQFSVVAFCLMAFLGVPNTMIRAIEAVKKIDLKLMQEFVIEKITSSPLNRSRKSCYESISQRFELISFKEISMCVPKYRIDDETSRFNKYACGKWTKPDRQQIFISIATTAATTTRATAHQARKYIFTK